MNLQPVDFKAVAAKGAYVYCYLRHSDSKTAPAGSPYYIGLSESARRPFNLHGKTPVPFDKALVRVLRSGLSLAEAEQWERFYIFKFGREEDGGILLNQKLGGEGGGIGYKHTDEWLNAHSRRMAGNQHTKGRTISEDHKLAISAHNKGQDNTKATGAAVASRIAQAAEKYGITVEVFAALSSRERAAICTRHSRGVRGEALFRSHQKGKSQEEANRKKEVAASRLGVDLSLYLNWTEKQRGRARYYANRGLSGSALVDAVA